jgi:transcriptional antiterminator
MALERIQSGIITSNPIMEEVYDSNPKLYDIVKQCFLDIFHGVSIPEDEVAYIVIYFIASWSTGKQVRCRSGRIVLPGSDLQKSSQPSGREFNEISV